MSKQASDKLSDYKFNGDSKNYNKFKEKLVGLLTLLDSQDKSRYVCDPKKHLKPYFTRVQILTTDVAEPAKSVEDGDDQEKISLSYELTIAEVRNTLNVVLPNSFSTDYSINQNKPYKIWKDLQRRYGVTTSVSIGKTLTAFDLSTCNPVYESVDQLMINSRKAFNTLNSELRQLLGLSDKVQFLPEELLSIHVLRCLPQEKAAQVPASKPKDFKIENMFRAIKQHVIANSKGLQKVKVNNVIAQSRKRKVISETPSSKCFYCFEPDHMKGDCKVRIRDRANLIFKGNIHAKASKRPASADQVKAAKQQTFNAPSFARESSQVNAISEQEPGQVDEAIEQVSSQVNSIQEGEMEVDDYLCPLQDLSLIEQFPEPDDEVINDLYTSLDDYHSNKLWVIDTGAGKSITGLGRLIIKDTRSTENPTEFQSPLPNSLNTCSKFKGTINITVNSNFGCLNFSVFDVYFVPGWDNNILSLYTLRQAGFTLVETRNPKFLVLRKDKHLVVAREIGGVYYLQTRDKPSELVNHIQESLIRDPLQISKTLKEWHMALGHLNKQALIKIMSQRLIEGIPYVPSSLLSKVPFFCKVCAQSKHNRMSYRNKTGSRPDKFFHRIHSDTMKVEVPGTYGNNTKIRYIQNFVDDYSSYKWIFLEDKINGAKSLSHLKQLQAQVKNKHDLDLKIFRSDNGSEYINDALITHLKLSGIDYEESNVECQEENGSSERYNQTLMNYARSMILGSGMPKRFWPEAVMHAHYLLNRLPTRRLNGKSPYEIANKIKPKLGKLPIWGTACYAHVPEKHRPHKKLAPRATRCRFLGLDLRHKDAYRLYNLETSSVFVSRDVRFNTTFTDQLHKRSFSEDEPLITSNELQALLTQAAKTSELSGSAGVPNPTDHDAQSTQLQATLASGGGTMPNNQLSSQQALCKLVDLLNEKHRDKLAASTNYELSGDVPKQAQSQVHKRHKPKTVISTPDSDLNTRRSKRQRTPSERGLLAIAQTSSINTQALKGQDIQEPAHLRAALSSPQKDKWIESMQREHDSLIQNNTWVLVRLPTGRKALSCKWVFRVKYLSDGTIEKYKSRLVIKGFLQREGIDYNEIFSPVIRMEALRLMLAIATILDLEIHQMDVATAFLNGEIDTVEPIFMKQPEGFHKGDKDQVCKLNKSLYGLKQAPRIWYLCLHKFLLSLGFERCKKEYCIYVMKANNCFAFVCVYVDDLTIICKDQNMLNKIKQDLSNKFKMTDLGEIHYLLRIKITRHRATKTLTLSQEKFINDLVKQYKLQDCELVETPQAISIELKADKTSNEMDKYPYPSLVGSLQYIIRGTRPDIANAVRELAKYTTCYNKSHWKAALRVLKYLKHTSTFGLVLNGQNTSLDYMIYTDASFGNANEGRKSVLGFCLMLAGAAITYKSSRANQIHLSTCEAETAAAVEGLKESEWLFELFKELSLARQGPITLFCDNNSAIAQIKNPCSHFSNKHIEIKQLYAREKFEEGRINVLYCNTHEMIADIFTKALPQEKFKYFRNKLGVLPLIPTTSKFE